MASVSGMYHAAYRKRHQFGVVGIEIERAVGHDRRDGGAGGNLHPAQSAGRYRARSPRHSRPTRSRSACRKPAPGPPRRSGRSCCPGRPIAAAGASSAPCPPCGSGRAAGLVGRAHRHNRPPPSGVWMPPISRDHSRSPVDRLIAAMTPEWLMAKTMSRSITGRPAMSSSSRQRGDLAGMGQHVAPGRLAVLHPQGIDLAGGVGHHDEFARHRGAGGGQDAGRFRDALMVPQSWRPSVSARA